MEKRIVDYIIKADANPAKLASEVAGMLEHGYQPYGSPCENGGGTVWQAMVKYDEEPRGPNPRMSNPTPMYKGIEVK
jgi:hypothetical protein